MRTRVKAHIVRVGNSRGIRIPKTLLQEAQLGDEIELQIKRGRIVIRKVAKPGSGWADAARHIGTRGEDRLLDQPTATRFDTEDW